MRRTKDQCRPGSSGKSARRARHGAVTLELILTLPIWLIFLLTVIEFGEILSNQQQVALASRVGAEEASQTAILPIADGQPVPDNVIDAIDQQLASSGISACRVIIEHNVVPAAPSAIPIPVTLSSGTCRYDPPAAELPPARHYVRVTVAVPLTELTPDLLGVFGFDISEKTLQHTTTFRYEL